MLTLITVTCLLLKLGYDLSDAATAERWLQEWGFVPAEVWRVLQLPAADWMNRHLSGLFTGLFVHVDWLHLIGNIAYLWVFGITVERAIGHWGLVLSFLLLGGIANLFLAWQISETTTPVIGASGGVSAIIGIYLGLFPGRRMGLWLPLGLYLQFARVPALLVIGSWFTLQLLYTLYGPESGSVAWWVHIAGFLGGLMTALLLRLFPRRVNLALHED